MKTEKSLVEYICRTHFEDIHLEALEVVRNMVLGIFGTTIAGATSEGCVALADFYKDLGGDREATVFIHGTKIPAQNAAFVNSVMARALDFDDAMAPGMHIGASAVPTAFAAAELLGGCNGKDFLTALVLGVETAARLNLTESAYDGFDPTGVCTVFAATVVACKILKLNEAETLNALALAFNKSGGSFQSNIDGSLAVRVIQGWASESGITCSRFAKLGVTGPENFLEGVYGYFHLYAKDMIAPESVLNKLGEEFELRKILFKKYPSCGLTLGSTDVVLSLIQEKNLSESDVERIEIRVPPYAYKLVGHPFSIGENPRVNAQFSIQYCVANALFRRCSRLSHFEESSVRDPGIMELVKKIFVYADPDLDKRGHTALDMKVVTNTGEEYMTKLDIAPGFPGNPLNQKDHEAHFRDCMEFSRELFPDRAADKIMQAINGIESRDDVRAMIPLLLI